MRILFVTSGYPSHMGQLHLYTILRGIGDRHDVDVIHFDAGEEYRMKADPPVRVGSATAIPWPSHSRSARLVRSLATGSPFAEQTHRSERMREAVRDACSREHYDLVLAEPLAMGQYSDAMGQAPRLLFAVDAISRAKLQQARHARSIARKLALRVDAALTRRSERRLYAQFDGVMLASSRDVEYARIHRLGVPDRVHAWPLGVDTDRYVPAGVDPEPDSLVILGSMANVINIRGVHWFHENVWPLVVAQRPGVSLTIVGTQPPPSVEALARDERIQVTGYVPDFRPLVARAAISLVPLPFGPGVKHRTLQTMAMGRPIVSTSAGVEGLDIQDGEHAMVCDEPRAFANAVLELLASPVTRDQLGSAARERALKEYSLGAAADRFLAIASRVIATAEARR